MFRKTPILRSIQLYSHISVYVHVFSCFLCVLGYSGERGSPGAPGECGTVYIHCKECGFIFNLWLGQKGTTPIVAVM